MSIANLSAVNAQVRIVPDCTIAALCPQCLRHVVGYLCLRYVFVNGCNGIEVGISASDGLHPIALVQAHLLPVCGTSSKESIQ